MAILNQSKNGYISYLGKYGKCPHADCESQTFDLASEPKIFSVISIDNFGTRSYIKGNPWFLQTIKKLECGVNYWITLEPGEDGVNIEQISISKDNFDENLIPATSLCEDDFENSVLLEQSELQYKSYMGWYGICDGTEFLETEISSYENIFSVIHTKEDGSVDSYTKGNPEFLQTLKTFKPGNAYWITLMPGTDAFIVDGFTFTKSTFVNEEEKPLLIEECLVKDKEIESTPTPTPKQKIKFPVMLVGWEWDARVDIFGREKWSSGSNKFGDENYLFDNYDYRKLTTDDVLKMLNAESYKHPLVSDEPTGSVSDYFRSISFGQLDIEFEILPANFEQPTDNTNPDEFAMIYNSPDVSCSYDTKLGRTEYEYELNNLINTGFNNIINNLKKSDRNYFEEFKNKPLTILHSGFSKTNLYGSGYFIRSHASSINVDGMRDDLEFSITNLKRLTDNKQASTLEPIGIIVHETIHTWGLIDLYDTSSRPRGTGMNKLAVMSYGASGSGDVNTEYLPTWPLGWTRYELSRAGLYTTDLIDITNSTKDIEIYPACEKNVLYRIKHPTENDYWWIDFRTPDATSNSGVNLDRFLSESGLCIVHQGISGGPSKNVWAYPLNRRGESGYYIALEQADGDFELQTRYKININNDLYKEGDEFSPYSIPSTVSRSGVPSGIKLHNIRKTERNTMMFDVEFLDNPNGKIVDVNYNFFDFDLTQSKTIVFDKKKFKERVIITITTENIPDGTRIDFQINPKTSMGITVGSGTISNNVCSIIMENDFMVNMTSQKQINYFYFKVGTNIKFKNTYPWMDYVVAK